MSNDCIACAYTEGAIKAVQQKAGPLGILVVGLTTSLADALAYGVGTGLLLASMTPDARHRVLEHLCVEHKRCLDEAQKGFERKTP